MTFRQSFYFSTHSIMHYRVFIQSGSTVHALQLFNQSESTLMRCFDLQFVQQEREGQITKSEHITYKFDPETYNVQFESGNSITI